VFYAFAITVPANTYQNAPNKTVLQLTAGTITQVQVHFPSGCVGLVYVQLSVGLYQLFPSNAEGSLSSDNESISWTDAIDLTQTPNQVICTAWNLDTVYQHTVTIRIGLEPGSTPIDLAAEIAQLLANQGA
jgi:hypothetical protein